MVSLSTIHDSIPNAAGVWQDASGTYVRFSDGSNRLVTTDEIAAAAAIDSTPMPDIPGFIAATKAAMGGIVAVNTLMRKYPTFLDAIQQQEWADVKALIQDALITGVLSPAQVTAIMTIAAQYHIPIPE